MLFENKINQLKLTITDGTVFSNRKLNPRKKPLSYEKICRVSKSYLFEKMSELYNQPIKRFAPNHLIAYKNKLYIGNYEGIYLIKPVRKTRLQTPLTTSLKDLYGLTSDNILAIIVQPDVDAIYIIQNKLAVLNLTESDALQIVKQIKLEHNNENNYF
jgi:hypothetical protein